MHHVSKHPQERTPASRYTPTQNAERWHVVEVWSRAAHLREALAPPLPSCDEKVAASWNASRRRRGACTSSSIASVVACAAGDLDQRMGSSVRVLVLRMHCGSSMAHGLRYDNKTMLLTNAAALRIRSALSGLFCSVSVARATNYLL